MKSTLASALLSLTLCVPIFAAEQALLRAASGDSGIRQAVVGQSDRVIPFVLNGNGFKTSFVLTNLDTKTVYVAFYFLASDGRSSDFPISGIGTVARLSATIPVNQTVTFETDGSGDGKEGCVIFFSVDRPADDPRATVVAANLGGMAIVRGAVPDQPTFETAIPITSVTETRFTMPYDNRDGLKTGMILLNVSVNSTPLTIIARDTDGNIIARDSATLNPTQRVSGLLTDLFPQTGGQTGIVQVSTTAIGLSGLGLRIDPTGRFTTIQTLSTQSSPSTSVPSTTPVYSGVGRNRRVSSVVENGAIVILDDGSVWEINFLDRLRTTLWLFFAPIEVTNAASPVGEFRYILINTNRQQEVRAKYLGTIS